MAAPAGFGDALARKYDIMQGEADARNKLLNTQADVLPGQAASENALRAQQIREGDIRASTLQPLAESTIAGTAGAIQEGAARARFDNTQSQALRIQGIDGSSRVARGILYDNHPGLGGGGGVGGGDGGVGAGVGGGGGGGISSLGGGMYSVPSNAPASTFSTTGKIGLVGGQDEMSGIGYSKGLTKVPGQGSGKVDKVPAMLAPGEAVLNKGAAEHVGRDNIKTANQIGLAKMNAGKGMPDAKKPQQLAKGTHHVMPGKSPPPGKMSPKGLAAVMQAMQQAQGAGGPPGGAPGGPTPMMPPGGAPPQMAAPAGRGMV